MSRARPALLLALALAPPASSQEAPSPLAPGDSVRATLTLGSPRRETPAIRAAAGGPVPALALALAVAEPGTYRLELVAHAFDAYLILLDGDGVVRAEADGGLAATHARLQVDLTPGDYRVAAASLDGGAGPFELRFLAGPAPEPSPEELLRLELADAAAAVAELEREGLGPRLRAALERRSDLLLAAGEPDAARPVLARLSEVQAKLGEDLAAARSALRAAELCLAPCPAEEGLASAARAALLFASAAGAPPAEAARARALQGSFLLALGRHAEAAAELDGACAALAAELGPASAPALSALADLHEALVGLGRPQEALRRDRDALAELLATPGGSAGIAPLCARLADLSRRVGDLDGAAGYLEELLRVPSAPGEERARRHLELGRVLLEAGDARRAAHQLVAAVQELDDERDETLPELRAARLDLARAHAAAGADREAAAELARLSETADRAAAPPGERAQVHRLRAELLERSGDAQAALRELSAARTALAGVEDGPDLLAATLEHARLAAREGDGAAIAELARVAAAAARMLDPDHPAVGEALLARGRALLVRREPRPAAEVLEQARAVLARSLGDGHARTVEATVELARAHASAGEAQRARALLLADLAARPAVAWEPWNHATEADRFAALRAEERELSLLLSLDRGESVDIEIYEAWARWRGVRASERLSTRSAFAARHPEAAAAARDLLRARIELARAALVDARALGGAAAERRSRVQERIRTLSAELARRVAPPAPRLPFEQIAWSLPPRGAIVDYASVAPPEGGAPRLQVWITQRDPARCTRLDLGPTAEAAERCALLASACEAGRAEDAQVLAELASQHLWRPVTRVLGDAQRVHLVVDPAIAALPFAALPAEDGTLAVEKRLLVRLTDPTRLVGREPRAGADGARRALLAACAESGPGGRGEREAAASLGAGPDPVWRPAEAPAIPGSRGDVELALARHAELAGSAARAALFGAEAEPERLARELAGKSAVVLALPLAWAPDALPRAFEPRPGAAGARSGGLPPGLLAGLVCPDPEEEGGRLLDAARLAGLRLSADLVVLTGSEVQPGDARAGAGLACVLRALEAAGARAVVAGCWRPRSEHVSALASDLLGFAWRDGAGPAEALRRAQLAALARARAEDGRPHPERWAGYFALLGRP